MGENDEAPDMSVPYQTSLEKSTSLLKNPVSIWNLVDTHEKHRLFFFLFEQKLAYSKNYGYRTADSLSTTRLFEGFAEQNPLDVEVGNNEFPSESVFESESTTRSQH